MSRTIGNLPTSYQVSMSYEEQVEEILRKCQEILDDTNEIITNYNIILEEYNNILEEYNSIINEFTEINNKIDTNTTNIGTLSNLTTTEKSNLVSAINEVDSNTDNNTTNIGTLSNLTTTEKSNLVGAINEVDSNTDTNTSNIGTLNNLTTTEKSNLVGAVNEVNSKVELTDTVKNFLAGYNPNNNNYYLRTENQDNSATQITAIEGTDLAVQKRVGDTWSNLFKLSDLLYYKNGDSYSANSDSQTLNGLITGASKTIRFILTTPKSLKNINSITINNLTLTIRYNGSYVPSARTDFKNDNNTDSCTAEIIDEHTIAIIINGTNAWTNASNNTQVLVTPYNNLKLTFNT